MVEARFPASRTVIPEPQGGNSHHAKRQELEDTWPEVKPGTPNPKHRETLKKLRPNPESRSL